MIALDLETSGVNPRENAILSIGAVGYEQPAKYVLRRMSAV
jgi:DNA polymerase III epsilon subunit-like protein